MSKLNKWITGGKNEHPRRGILKRKASVVLTVFLKEIIPMREK